LVSQLRNGVRYYYYMDGLGSVMQVTDGSQNIVASYKYDAWGNDLTDPQSPIPNPFKYVGGLGYYSEKDSGLKLLGVRYYDSQIGRFWSLDPIKDRRNWYAYSDDNPVNKVDPHGLSTWWDRYQQYKQCLEDCQIQAQQCAATINATVTSVCVAACYLCAAEPTKASCIVCGACLFSVLAGIATCDVFYDLCRERCRKKYPLPIPPGGSAGGGFGGGGGGGW